MTFICKDFGADKLSIVMSGAEGSSQKTRSPFDLALLMFPPSPFTMLHKRLRFQQYCCPAHTQSLPCWSFCSEHPASLKMLPKPDLIPESFPDPIHSPSSGCPGFLCLSHGITTVYPYICKLQD